MTTNSGLGSAACLKYESFLEDYLNGDLSDADAKLAADHWKNCAGCQSALERGAASKRLLRAVEPSSDPGPAFARIAMTRIRVAEQERAAGRAGFWQSFVSLGWRFAATASLALVALVTYDARWARAPQPNGAAVRPIESIDIFAPEPAKPPANGDEVLMMVAEGGHGK